MARRRTVLTIPVPAGGVEMADVLAVLTGVGPSYDLTRIEVQSTIEGENFLVLTAGQRRLRPGVLIGAEPLPGIDEDWSPSEEHLDRLDRAATAALADMLTEATDMLTEATGIAPTSVKVTAPRPTNARIDGDDELAPGTVVVG